jgi:hypothetical protein
MENKKPLDFDEERKRDAQDVVGSEGGVGHVGSPSRTDKAGHPPREQSPAKPGTHPDDRLTNPPRD